MHASPTSAAAAVAARGFVVPPDVVTLPVVVDERERVSGLPDRLTAHGLRVEVRRLDVGDVVIGDRIHVERKTVLDLLASMREGRLFDQAFRLGGCARPLVIIEGDPYELVHHDLASQVRGVILSLLVGYRVPVAQTGSIDETAACLVHLALQEQRRQRRRRRRALDATQPQARAILESCPEIGPARARALVEALGSVRGVALADPDTLTRIPGIGPLTAARLVDALSRRSGDPPA